MPCVLVIRWCHILTANIDRGGGELHHVVGTLQKVYSKHLTHQLEHDATCTLMLTRHLVHSVPAWPECTAEALSYWFLEMKKRLIQILGFLITSLGWVFVLCTMAMDFWRISQIGGQGGSFIIKVAWYWSNLWKDCFTDSTAVTNCRDFPVLWSVTGKQSNYYKVILTIEHLFQHLL